jgi:hypothetical protein
VVSGFDPAMAPMYRVALTSHDDDDQLWFMLGLPVTFLAKMYRIKRCSAYRVRWQLWFEYLPLKYIN